MEPESLFPHSQVSVTCPYPEPAWSSPYPHIPLPEDITYYYPLIYSWDFKVVSFSKVSPPNPVYTSPPPNTRYMPTYFILLDFITRTVVGEMCYFILHILIQCFNNI
jgi:hypothetical protein